MTKPFSNMELISKVKVRLHNKETDEINEHEIFMGEMCIRDRSQAAKLLTEGCNMGIETISGSLNEYRDADSKSVAIAERLRTVSYTHLVSPD